MDSPTSNSSPEPAIPPDDASTWLADAKELLSRHGDVWAITRAMDDPFTLIAERQRGTELHVIAGTPKTIMRRIAELPAEAPKAAEIRGDHGSWISGMQLP